MISEEVERPALERESHDEINEISCDIKDNNTTCKLEYKDPETGESVKSITVDNVIKIQTHKELTVFYKQNDLKKFGLQSQEAFKCDITPTEKGNEIYCQEHTD